MPTFLLQTHHTLLPTTAEFVGEGSYHLELDGEGEEGVLQAIMQRVTKEEKGNTNDTSGNINPGAN